MLHTSDIHATRGRDISCVFLHNMYKLCTARACDPICHINCRLRAWFEETRERFVQLLWTELLAWF